eukprot:252285_1
MSYFTSQTLKDYKKATKRSRGKYKDIVTNSKKKISKHGITIDDFASLEGDLKDMVLYLLPRDPGAVVTDLIMNREMRVTFMKRCEAVERHIEEFGFDAKKLKIYKGKKKSKEDEKQTENEKHNALDVREDRNTIAIEPTLNENVNVSQETDGDGDGDDDGDNDGKKEETEKETANEFNAMYEFDHERGNEVVVVRGNSGKHLRIAIGSNNQVDGNGGTEPYALWKVILGTFGMNIIKLKNTETGKYLRIERNREVTVGEGDQRAMFLYHKHHNPNEIQIESAQMKGRYVAISPNGDVICSDGKYTHLSVWKRGAATPLKSRQRRYTPQHHSSNHNLTVNNPGNRSHPIRRRHSANVPYRSELYNQRVITTKSDKSFGVNNKDDNTESFGQNDASPGSFCKQKRYKKVVDLSGRPVRHTVDLRSAEYLSQQAQLRNKTPKSIKHRQAFISKYQHKSEK